MGGEVHIDIYDERVELVSPSAMLDGTQIQERDIYKVSSMRRNPVSCCKKNVSFHSFKI